MGWNLTVCVYICVVVVVVVVVCEGVCVCGGEGGGNKYYESRMISSETLEKQVFMWGELIIANCEPRGLQKTMQTA